MTLSALAKTFVKEVRARGLLKAVASSVQWARTSSRARDPELQRHVRHFNDFFFDDLGISRKQAEAVYRAGAEKVGFTAGEGDSIHRLAFASLAVSGFEPETILELGTSHGETTRFLSELFPRSRIYTVELAEDDPLYRRMHPHGKSRDENVEKRLAHPNITALRKNTVFLQDLDLPDFDLIWLDAGHHFPEVAWDHFFCMKKLKPGGWLFTDDVMLPDNPLAIKRPEILDVWRVVDYFNQRQDAQFKLLLKRENVRQYAINVKHVGFYRSPENP